jgi:hypothetical protein
METTRCIGCGGNVPAQPGTCRRCGFTRGTTAAQRVAFGLSLFAISALMAYVGWSHIPQVAAYPQKEPQEATTWTTTMKTQE